MKTGQQKVSDWIVVKKKERKNRQLKQIDELKRDGVWIESLPHLNRLLKELKDQSTESKTCTIRGWTKVPYQEPKRDTECYDGNQQDSSHRKTEFVGTACDLSALMDEMKGEEPSVNFVGTSVEGSLNQAFDKNTLRAKLKAMLKNRWLFDSGASNHISRNATGMFDIVRESTEVKLANGKTVHSPFWGKCRGIIRVMRNGRTCKEELTLLKVLYVPDMDVNVL